MSVRRDGDKQQADRWATALSLGKSAGWPGSWATSGLCRRGPRLGWRPLTGLRGPHAHVACTPVFCGNFLLFLTTGFWGSIKLRHLRIGTLGRSVWCCVGMLFVSGCHCAPGSLQVLQGPVGWCELSTGPPRGQQEGVPLQSDAI